MIFIYNCYGGTHSSSLASAIHLGNLPFDRVPSKKEILGTAYFDRLRYKDMGRIIYRGTDKRGNNVYTLGRGTSRAIIPALNNLLSILKSECSLKEEIVFTNMSPTVPPLMTVGGFLSRGLKLHFLGRPLLMAGAQQAYFNIVGTVADTLEVYGLKIEDVSNKS
jgi:Protein of unknown function (DUF3189).